MWHHNSFNAVLIQALADPATILLIRFASESRGRIVCELVSPHGFSVSTNTDGEITACPIDVFQGLFSSSFVCKDRTMVSIYVEEVQVDIGPVTNRERVAYTAASVHHMEAKAHLEDGQTRIETDRPYADLFQVSFEAPRTAFVQFCHREGKMV